MTPPKSQPAAARIIIGLLSVFALVVMGLPGVSLGGVPAAQQTSSSPSPSRSASPSSSASSTASPAPTGPAIQFLNPSSHSDIVSGKNDGVNTTYHLTAWTRALPSNPLVEFKYQAGGSNEVTIGIGTKVGDSYEIAWNLASVEDGSYVVKAILYSGSTEVARDEEDVVVNQSDDSVPPDPQAETVEITHPTFGGTLGFFTSPAGVKTAVVDVSSSAANPQPSFSAGTTFVRILYTVTAAGSEPQWKACGTESKANSADGVRCTLTAADAITSVTAIAAVANSAPAQSGFQDSLIASGDAHRIDPYAQTPTTITLSPSSQSKAPGACSDVVTATVLDQNGQKIAALNADVHGKGPTDNLLFDDSGNNSSAHQAPNKAHSANESAWDCESSGLAGTQGQHELPPPDVDIKHIESTTGTNDAGAFKFQFYSPDSGTTEFAVFADVDDDDQWCSEEASGEGTVTWSTTASPSPTPSSSQSSSASPSPSSSGSVTSLEPDETTCPAPTPTATSTAGGGNRSISLATSASKVKTGAEVTFSGQVESTDDSCEDNELVEIQRRVHGTETFQDFKTTASGADGSFEATSKVTKSADYQAMVTEAAGCDGATSAPATVLVKVKVSIAGSDKTPAQGAKFSISGKVTPNHSGTKVILQRLKGKKWVKVASTQLNNRSRYSFSVTAGWGGEVRKFRVKWPSADQDHQSGKSATLKINPV